MCDFVQGAGGQVAVDYHTAILIFDSRARQTGWDNGHVPVQIGALKDNTAWFIYFFLFHDLFWRK